MSSEPRVSGRHRRGQVGWLRGLVPADARAARLIVRSASSMFGTTAVTALLGYAFWGVAARAVSPGELGAASAAVSAMQLIATFGTFGLGTLLMAELGSLRGPRRPLVATCVWLAASGSALAAAVYAVLFGLLGPSRSALYGSGAGVALFAVGTGVTAGGMVLDGALIGLLRGSVQLWRNAVASAVKVALVPLALVGGPAAWSASAALFAWWLVGNVASLGVVARSAHRPLAWLGTRPSVEHLRGLGRSAAGHHWVNVAVALPRLALPVLVSVQLGDEVNAGFYAALLLAGFVWIVPNHLATAMFAVNAHDPSTLGSELRRVWRWCWVYSVVATVAVGALATPLLAVFGPSYTAARPTLVVLAVVTLPAAIKSLYIAVRRARGELGRAATATAAGTAVELALAEAGLVVTGDVVGVGVGLAAAMALEVAWYWPVVRGAMHGVRTR